jgi:hypothetical protein
MCLLCVEIQKKSLAPEDFVRNFGELNDTDPKHAEEVASKSEKEIEELLPEDPFDDFWAYGMGGD